MRNCARPNAASSPDCSRNCSAPSIDASVPDARMMLRISTDRAWIAMNRHLLAFAALILSLLCTAAEARRGETPWSIGDVAKRGMPPAEIRLAAIDAAALRAVDDARRQASGTAHAKRLAIAEERKLD